MLVHASSMTVVKKPVLVLSIALMTTADSVKHPAINTSTIPDCEA